MVNIAAIRNKVSRILADDSKTYARTPRAFALKDWKEALLQTKNAMKNKRIPVLSAGVAYFATLAVFPAIAAAVGILSFALSGSQVESVFQSIETYLPSDIAGLISTQLNAAIHKPSSGVFLIIVGILIALFSISGAVSNIISAANAIYEATETRKFIKLRLTSLVFILGTAIVILIAAGLLVLNDSFLESIGIPEFIALVVLIIRWIVIAVLVAVAIAAFYRFAPNRATPYWQWVSWGSCIATIIWLLGTTAFFIYAKYFAHFTDAYSVFAGIIVLMTWFNLTAFAILLGAEINYHLERQTLVKTTK